MTQAKVKRQKAIDKFHLAGVSYGTRELVHASESELDTGFLGLLRRACADLYGPRWPERLKMEVRSDNGGQSGT